MEIVYLTLLELHWGWCVFGFESLSAFTVKKCLVLKTRDMLPKEWKKLRILTHISIVEDKVYVLLSNSAIYF